MTKSAHHSAAGKIAARDRFVTMFELASGLLFSRDTLFAGGVLSYIAESGSVGDSWPRSPSSGPCVSS